MPTVDQLDFSIKQSLYPLTAIYAACYTFTDKAYIRLDLDPQGDVQVSLKAKPEAPGKAIESLQGEFYNELLHQALRLKISESNQKIREYVVTQALLAAQPTADVAAAKTEAEQAPVLDESLEKEIEALLAQVEKESDGKDPLKIATAWEDGSGRAPAAAPGGPDTLEAEVEKLLDHAEAQSRNPDPAGGPVAWQALAERAGRKVKSKSKSK